MKKFLTTAMIVSTLFCLCSCKDYKNNIFFENKTGEQIDGIYVSSGNSDKWGGKLNEDAIKSGSTLTIPKEKLVDGEGSYDIGAIDHNGQNYDIYEVDISFGDTITLSSENGYAVITVTSSDGDKKDYTGEKIYKDEV